MAQEFENLDLYVILGLEFGVDEKHVAKAYKKKSLLHHPDRGGDVKKFLELKHARDILLDPKKKEDYDKKISQELLAKKKQREREAELDEKRRRMRDELLRKEKSVEERTRDRSVYKKSDLSKFREKGLAQQEALREKLARDARWREELRSYQASAISGEPVRKSQRTVTFKWDKKRYSHSDETIVNELRQYGEIESVKLKLSSAKVLFTETSAASNAVRIEGHKDCWRSVSLQGHIVEKEDIRHTEEKFKANEPVLPDFGITWKQHVTFEKRVLEKITQKLKEQQQSKPVSI